MHIIQIVCSLPENMFGKLQLKLNSCSKPPWTDSAKESVGRTLCQHSARSSLAGWMMLVKCVISWRFSDNRFSGKLVSQQCSEQCKTGRCNCDFTKCQKGFASLGWFFVHWLQMAANSQRSLHTINLTQWICVRRCRSGGKVQAVTMLDSPKAFKICSTFFVASLNRL